MGARLGYPGSCACFILPTLGSCTSGNKVVLLYLYLGIVIATALNCDNMAGSEEYNKLFYRRPTIIKALAAERCTVDLAGRLQIRGLISDDVYSQATNYALVDSERLRIILEAVLAKVDLNPQRYDEFIDVLQEIGALEDLVSIIEGKVLLSFCLCSCISICIFCSTFTKESTSR